MVNGDLFRLLKFCCSRLILDFLTLMLIPLLDETMDSSQFHQFISLSSFLLFVEICLSGKQ